ncbi:MAG: DinB family protein [Candidatus Eisenbacteria bacterium]|nr:DinB family protein [Candidatus Eisenbacteria bacterium]
MKRNTAHPAIRAYIRKTLDFIGDSDPVALLRSNPARVARAVKGLTPTQLQKRPRPGKWSIQEILGHLADCEAAFAWRFRRALGEPGSPVYGFDQERWAAAFHYQRIPAKRSLANYVSGRAATLTAIEFAGPRARAKAGIMHSERGREPFDHLCRMAAGHDLNHLSQIQAIRKKFGWGAKRRRAAAKPARPSAAKRGAKSRRTR